MLKTDLLPVCKAHSTNAFNYVYISNDGLQNFIAKETILACNQPGYNAKAIILSIAVLAAKRTLAGEAFLFFFFKPDSQGFRNILLKLCTSSYGRCCIPSKTFKHPTGYVPSYQMPSLIGAMGDFLFIGRYRS